MRLFFKTVLCVMAFAMLWGANPTHTHAQANLKWAHALSGADYEAANSVATDNAGNVFIAGFFHLTIDFDPDTGTFNLSFINAMDIFLAKYDSTGSLLWAHRFGGTGTDRANSVTTDAFGNVLITGLISGSVDFDPGPGTAILTRSGAFDCFIAKYDPLGNLLWAKLLSGPHVSEGNALAVDDSNNILVTGYFQLSVDFDPGVGTAIRSGIGATDIFVAKYTPAGNFMWVHTFGGTSDDYGNSVTADAAGNVWLTGRFQIATDFDDGPGTAIRLSAGSHDIFLAKFSSGGNLIRVNSYGSSGFDIGMEVLTDTADNVFLAGMFAGSIDFDPGVGVDTRTALGNTDAMLVKYDAAGDLLWVHSFGGPSAESIASVGVDEAGNSYLSGIFSGTADFDLGPGTDLRASLGFEDIYILKFDGLGNQMWASNMGGPGSDWTNDIAIDKTDNILLCGDFQNTLDMDPDTSTYNLTAVAFADIFFARYGQGPPPTTPTPTPNLWLTGNGFFIANGDTLPTTIDNTDFGTTTIGSPITKTFGIKNTGTDTLIISAYSFNPSTFIFISQAPSAPISPGDSATLSLTYNPQAAGIHSTVLSLLSNDIAQSPYNFKITGQALAPPPAGALKFDGVNDYVLAPQAGSVANFLAFTVEAWVKWDGISIGAIYAESNSGVNNPILSIIARPNIGGKLEIVLRDYSAIGLVNSATNGMVLANVWTHVAFVRTSATTAKLYINGTETDNFVFTAPGPWIPNRISIGARMWIVSNSYMNGSLDEVRVWKKALCATEIQSRMNCELTGTETDLRAYYNFNNPNAIAGGPNTGQDTLTDNGPNGNTGALVNFALTDTVSNWVTGAPTVGGTCLGNLAPEMTVVGNGVEIPNSTVPALLANHTDFGVATLGQSVVRTFTIKNDNLGVLTVSIPSIVGPIVNPFVVTQAPDTVLAAGDSTTFQITFIPASAGVHIGLVFIANNDCDENPYRFQIKGVASSCDSALLTLHTDSLDPFSSHVTNTTVRINWSQVSMAERYEVRGKRIPYNWQYFQIPGGAPNYKNISGLINNRIYVWQIRALCDSLVSPWSDMDTFNTGCLQPDSIWVTNVTATTVKLNWNPELAAVAYQIRGSRIGSASQQQLLVTGGNSSFKTINGLMPGMAYQWKMRSICSTNGSARSTFTRTDTFTMGTLRLADINRSESTGVVIYPNPMDDQTVVSFAATDETENSSVVLTDINGRTVRRYESLQGNRLVIERADLASGLYFIEIKMEDRVVRQKLIVK